MSHSAAMRGVSPPRLITQTTLAFPLAEQMYRRSPYKVLQSRKFMICSYWGIHTFIRREVFHLHVWCSSRPGYRRSLCASCQWRSVFPREDPGPINPDLSRKTPLFSQIYSYNKHTSHHTRLFPQPSMRKYTETREKCNKSSCLSFCISKSGYSLWIWALAVPPLCNITKGVSGGCGNHPDSEESLELPVMSIVVSSEAQEANLQQDGYKQNTWFLQTLWSLILHLPGYEATKDG